MKKRIKRIQRLRKIKKIKRTKRIYKAKKRKENLKQNNKIINKNNDTKKNIISESQCLSYLLNVGEYLGDGITEITYKNKDKKLCCIMSVSGIDIFNYTEEDIVTVCDNFSKATTSLRLPHKYVFTDKHPDLSKQYDFIKYKHEKSTDFSKAFLRNQLEQNQNIQKTQRDKLAYLIVFSDNKDELYKNCKMYINQMNDTIVKFCDVSETKEFLRRYLCCSDNVLCKSDVLPHNMETHQSYSIIDDHYITTIIVNDYPAEIKNLELASIIQRLSNATVTLDVNTQSKAVVLKEIDRSTQELNSRFLINRTDSEDSDTKTELEKLRTIREDIANGNEQFMYITLRIIAYQDSYDKLLDHVDFIQKLLEDEGITGFVPINQMKDEFSNLLKPNNIANNPFPLHNTFKMQYPFFYQQHLDANSLMFGSTGTSGLVSIDFFARDNYRQSYDLMMVGLKGSGKSANLKSMVRDYVALGNKVMVIDVESEYETLSKMHDGQIIRMNKYSIINVFQLHQTVDNSREEDATNETNFAAELSRIITFFYQYLPGMNELEGEELKDIIYDTYKSKGIIESTDISTLAPKDFPIFSDVLENLRNRLYNEDGTFSNNYTQTKIDSLQKIEVYIKQLAEGVYSTMFNGYSNIDISSSNLIVFDVKSLSEMDERIYNAQLFNILSLMWSEVCKNVEYNNHINNPYDRKYIVCLIDEAHRFINSRNLQVTDFIEKLVRRTRKYDAALWLASQALSDFNPVGNDAGAEKVKVIFSLIQYKIILKQSYENIAVIHNSFAQFTMSEIKSTTEFRPGEMLIALGSGRNKLHCLRYIDDATMLYAGNSRDREEIIHKIFNALYHDLSKEEYAKQIVLQKETFHDGFTIEVLEYLNYQKSDSEVLYNIVYSTVLQLINEFCSLIDENERSL